MSLASYYPISSLKPLSETAYKTTYEWMVSTGVRNPSGYPPGYTGHQTGASREIGYGNPGSRPDLLQKTVNTYRSHPSSPGNSHPSSVCTHPVPVVDQNEVDDLTDDRTRAPGSEHSPAARMVDVHKRRYMFCRSSEPLGTTYCPPAYRVNISPISQFSVTSERKQNSERRALSDSAFKFHRDASGSGTGFSVGNKSETRIWDFPKDKLSTLTVYRDSFRNTERLPKGVWVAEAIRSV